MKRIASVCRWGIILAAIGSAQASLITVTNLNDSGPGSLRQAVAGKGSNRRLVRKGS